MTTADLDVFAVLFLRLVLALLIFKPLGLGLYERVVVAVVRVEALTVQVQYVGGNCVEKLAVVRHDQNRRRPRLYQSPNISFG